MNFRSENVLHVTRICSEGKCVFILIRLSYQSVKCSIARIFLHTIELCRNFNEVAVRSNTPEIKKFNLRFKFFKLCVSAPSIPTTDLFMHSHKQTINYFVILLSIIIDLGFLNVYVNFTTLTFRKRDYYLCCLNNFRITLVCL